MTYNIIHKHITPGAETKDLVETAANHSHVLLILLTIYYNLSSHPMLPGILPLQLPSSSAHQCSSSKFLLKITIQVFKEKLSSTTSNISSNVGIYNRI